MASYLDDTGLKSKGEGLMVFSRKPICQVREANSVPAAQWVWRGKGVWVYYACRES